MLLSTIQKKLYSRLSKKNNRYLTRDFEVFVLNRFYGINKLEYFGCQILHWNIWDVILGFNISNWAWIVGN